MPSTSSRFGWNVHDDLYLLADHGITHIEEDDRAKKPCVPYDTGRIGVEFGLPQGESSESAASA